MPYTQSIQANGPLFSFGANTYQPVGGTPTLRDNKVIVIPFKPVSPEQAENLYDQKVSKRYKIDQLKQMGYPKANLDFLQTMYDWGEIHVNVAKRTLTIGDLNGDRVETTYNKQGEHVKEVHYLGKKKFVEEFKDGCRLFTEYEKNDKGQYVKKYYEKNPENNFTKVLEQKSY